MNEQELAYLEAAEALASARVRFSEAFLLNRVRLGRDGTDKQAESHAIILTSDDVTVYQAELEIKRRRLDVAKSSASPGF